MRRATQWVNGEVVTTRPQMRLMNSLPFNGAWEERILFDEKLIKYNGFGLLQGNMPIIMRMMIVRKNQGGSDWRGLPTEEEIFGTSDTTIATDVTREWKKISDRHFLFTQNEDHGMELTHKHRLTHSLSLQEPSLRSNKIVTANPMYLIFFADWCGAESRIILQRFETIIYGNVSFVPNAIDDDDQI